MKKTILLGAAAASLLLFSCGETTSPQELESVVTEINTAQDELDSMEEEINAIDEEVEGLESELEDLDI